jgi:hypothetical protein
MDSWGVFGEMALYTKRLYVIILLHVIIGEEVWITETSSKN